MSLKKPTKCRYSEFYKQSTYMQIPWCTINQRPLTDKDCMLCTYDFYAYYQSELFTLRAKHACTVHCLNCVYQEKLVCTKPENERHGRNKPK